ncbi:MAG: 4Fe-4S dicluster domain-containing protein [Pseudomonadota bacterium]
MSKQVNKANPELAKELQQFGAEDVRRCYQCGNCASVCAHAGDPWLFPRRSVHMLQLGLEERLKSSLEPWLCYYCGDCSTECPREAEPGETMMALRRWLTSKYDFTGLSRLFYRSGTIEIFAIVLVALLTGAGFMAWGLSQGDIRTYDGPTAFLDSSVVHIFDWVMGSVLFALLSINALRMWWFTTGSGVNVKVPIGSYLRTLYLFPLHFITQRRYRDCEEKKPWLFHLILVLSYLTMLVLIMFFLHDMQEGPAINWFVHAPGYIASIGLLAVIIYSIRARLKKSAPHSQQSHESDWIFLILLLVVTATGILQHVLHRAGLDMAANITYVAHLMFVVPMLVLEVPFSKWSHMAYRPLAMFLAAAQCDALAQQQKEAPFVQGAVDPVTGPEGNA